MRYLKFIIIPLWLMLNGLGAKAQSGYTYFNVSGGYLFKPLNGLTGTISLEFASKYHNSFEIFAEGYRSKYKQVNTYVVDTVTKRTVTDINNKIRQNYLLGFVYKPLITRSKNTTVRFKMGSGFGSNGKDFIVAPQAGFEISEALSGGVELMLQQNNSYVFWDVQHWRSGAALGIKIPIN